MDIIILTLMVVAAIIFLGHLAEVIFDKFDIPDILILIFIGIAIAAMGWSSATDFGTGATLFTTFALIFILFQGALNINFKTLMRSLPKTMKLTIFNFILTIVIITAIALLMGYDLLIAILIGTILSGTSSAVVIPLVHSSDIRDKYGSVLKLESAVSDVLCIVGTITVLEIIETGKLIPSGIFQSVFISFILAIAIGFLAGFAWVALLKKSEGIKKSYMLTIAFVIAIYSFTEWLGASGAISALTFGLVLGNSRMLIEIANKEEDKNGKKKKKLEETSVKEVLTTSARSFYSEISFFVKTFFFVYLGMLINFSNPWIFLYGALITLGIYLIRPIAVKLTYFTENVDHKARAILEVMAPKGLAAAVLAGVAVQSGLLNGAGADFTNLILSVILVSIIFTSVLMFLVEREKFKGFMPFLYSKEEPNGRK